MEYRTLGNSGLQVSVAGLGCNNFGMRIDAAQSEKVVNTALDEGITFFDTADVYGSTKSEEFVGQALGARRHEVVIATKWAMQLGEGPYKRGGSRHYIYKAVEDSRQLADADWTARSQHLTRFVSAQNEWSLLNRAVEHEVIPACEQFGVGQLPFFPLASGFLTGKYKRGEDLPEGTRLEAWAKAMPERIAAQTSDANWDKLAGLTTFAEERGHSILELALCWLATRPVVSSVIAGATKPEQVKSNVASTMAWRLSDEEMAEVDTILGKG